MKLSHRSVFLLPIFETVSIEYNFLKEEKSKIRELLTEMVQSLINKDLSNARVKFNSLRQFLIELGEPKRDLLFHALPSETLSKLNNLFDFKNELSNKETIKNLMEFFIPLARSLKNDYEVCKGYGCTELNFIQSQFIAPVGNKSSHIKLYHYYKSLLLAATTIDMLNYIASTFTAENLYSALAELIISNQAADLPVLEKQAATHFAELNAIYYDKLAEYTESELQVRIDEIKDSKDLSSALDLLDQFELNSRRRYLNPYYQNGKVYINMTSTPPAQSRLCTQEKFNDLMQVVLKKIQSFYLIKIRNLASDPLNQESFDEILYHFKRYCCFTLRLDSEAAFQAFEELDSVLNGFLIKDDRFTRNLTSDELGYFNTLEIIFMYLNQSKLQIPYEYMEKILVSIPCYLDQHLQKCWDEDIDESDYLENLNSVLQRLSDTSMINAETLYFVFELTDEELFQFDKVVSRMDDEKLLTRWFINFCIQSGKSSEGNGMGKVYNHLMEVLSLLLNHYVCVDMAICKLIMNIDRAFLDDLNKLLTCLSEVGAKHSVIVKSILRVQNSDPQKNMFKYLLEQHDADPLQNWEALLLEVEKSKGAGKRKRQQTGFFPQKKSKISHSPYNDHDVDIKQVRPQ